MQLSPLQLEIMQLGADKSLSFGCLVKYNGDIYILVDTNKLLSYVDDKIYENEYDYKYLSEREYEIIGHPIRYDRLCYLNITQSSDKYLQEFGDLSYAFLLNPELYKQSILEWDSITINLVKDFLLSIQ